MANTQLFKSSRGQLPPSTNALNLEGCLAYEFTPKHKLAQYAATGCLSNTYYANAETQLDTILALCAEVDPQFIAKTAIYCRERGYMKDTPALLAVVLTTKGQEYLPAVFERVIGSGKMLRNFVQIMRSGAAGRKSLGTRPKKLIQNWLNNAAEKDLLSAAIGATPSLADVVKMVHPKPSEAWRETWFAWLIGKPFNEAKLPPLTRAFEAYKRDRTLAIPDVPFQMLTALELGKMEWAQIARQGGWHLVRMNLNTFARHGVFELNGMAELVAAKLKDANAIAKAKVFPYQLLAAYKSVNPAAPMIVREALQDAMELALANVPTLDGKVVVCPDVSGSMASPVTGARGSATTSVRCIDVAALVAAAVLRKNPSSIVMPFENRVVNIRLNPRDAVLTNADKLASIGGGGTNCSAPLAKLNADKAKADVVILVSDNESWVDATRRGATATMHEWQAFKQRNPMAKLICIDMQPYGTTQANEREDILNVGGFSDEVFKIIGAFVDGRLSASHWMSVIEGVSLQ
jgi:60 kDa SS-A/Ro ribonucleoprotein